MFGMQIGRMGQTGFVTWDRIVATMYQNGEVGANLKPLDFSKIWQDSAATTPYTAVEQYVGKIVDSSPNALAFTQATSSARPVLSARVNLHPNTNLSVAGKLVAGSGVVPAVTPNQIAPDGSLSAYRVELDSGGAAGSYSILSMGPDTPQKAAPYTSEIWLKENTGGSQYVGYVGSGSDQKFILVTDVWTKFTYAETGIAGGQFTFRLSSAYGAASNGYRDVLVWHPQLTLGAANARWQSVNTSTDYDTAGFPHYLKFDGIDDNLVSATGGGGTAGIYFCGAIQFNKVGAVQTIFSDAGTNSGYKLQLTAANQLQISAGNGTAFTAINTTDTFALGNVTLCEFWDDGTTLGVRLGEGTPVTISRPVVTAGTAQITLGKANNSATEYAGISMFEPVWRYGAMPNTTQREAIRAYCRSKAGIA